MEDDEKSQIRVSSCGLGGRAFGDVRPARRGRPGLDPGRQSPGARRRADDQHARSTSRRLRVCLMFAVVPHELHNGVAMETMWTRIGLVRRTTSRHRARPRHTPPIDPAGRPAPPPSGGHARSHRARTDQAAGLGRRADGALESLATPATLEPQAAAPAAHRQARHGAARERDPSTPHAQARQNAGGLNG